MNKTVAVALSGGVDSAVSALLLKEQGYNVFGITGKMTCDENSEQVINNARKVAEKLNIFHYVFDATEIFNHKVVKYFEESYKNGETPNPCIMCNKYIKWGAIYNYATKTIGADFIATGHYANIKKDGKFYKLYPASDEVKDQLYFLFNLNQEQLARTLFPLSSYKKEDIKSIAEKYDLPPKSAKESQDICFIKPPMTTKKYLNSILPEQIGSFVEKSSGKILGKHKGFWQYTIGQRKGIGIAAPEALYVLGTVPATNTVYVGYEKELYSNTLSLKEINWSYPIFDNELEVMVKIRYNMPAIPAKITKDLNQWIIHFNNPISGVTPGQACVIYDKIDGHLLGGSFI
jgi:tRNA-specific 2-thiouridylase